MGWELTILKLIWGFPLKFEEISVPRFSEELGFHLSFLSEKLFRVFDMFKFFFKSPMLLSVAGEEVVGVTWLLAVEGAVEKREFDRFCNICS